jgi:uncharacterized protein (DUF1330 family)
MTVYVVNNLRIHDRAEYGEYVSGFMEAFRGCGGEILAVQDAPQAFEGEWPYDRTVLLRFPSRGAITKWVQSPAYQAIVGHRHRGAQSNIVILDAFAMPGVT